ncbi:MAG TPA: hypothetical protein VFN71_05960 [Methylomirabilota bacterium]|nr:hypothetical protein [Methylomirabilota bacterium]
MRSPGARRAVTIAAVTGALLWAVAPARAAAQPAASPWQEFTQMTVAGTPLDGSASRFEMSFEVVGPARDVKILASRLPPGEPARAEMLLIHNRVWLVRGVEPAKDAEIDLLDEQVLTLQLVLRLLELGHPAGPAAVRESVAVNVRAAAERISVSTSSAGGEFGPPIAVRGRLAPAGAHSVAYRLDFAYGSPSRSTSFKGVWTRLGPTSAMRDDTDVSAYAVYVLGPRRVERGGGVILDYGATRAPGAATLGEIRTRYPAAP